MLSARVSTHYRSEIDVLKLVVFVHNTLQHISSSGRFGNLENIYPFVQIVEPVQLLACQHPCVVAKLASSFSIFDQGNATKAIAKIS